MKNDFIPKTGENSDCENWREQKPYQCDPPFSDPTYQESSQKDVEQFQSALKKVTLMTGMAFHDICNEISVIHGERMLLDCKMQDYPDLRMPYECIMKAVDRIWWHTETARSYMDPEVPPSTWLSLQDLVQRTVAEIPHDTVDLMINVGSAEIYADKLMEKVFFNLIENALSHGGNVSEIQIVFSEEENGATITVKDNGCGIPKKNKSRIFGYGFGSHTGMGLFFTQRALKIFNFSIREIGVEGCGAQFEIRVPSGRYRCVRNT